MTGNSCRILHRWMARTGAAVIALNLAFQSRAIAQDGEPDGLARDIPTSSARSETVAGDSPVVTHSASAPAPTDAGLDSQSQINQEAINAAVDRRLKEIEQAKQMQDEEKKRLAEEQGYEVGSDLSVKSSFKDGMFLWLETPNKDFTMHLGAWLQMDNVWWNESPALKAAKGPNAGAAQGVASGDTLGGIGDLQDGTYFRRIRPFVEGAFWESGEYRLILAAENMQFNTSGLDEFWVGAKDVPIIGTARIGHIKDPMGLEGDMTASSRSMTFLERSSYSEAIELNQNFVTGLLLSNNYLDQHATVTVAAFRTDLGGSSGVFFGDGQSGVQGRLTALPLDEDEGRHLMHFGLSAGWRSGSANLANSPFAFRTMQLRARPEMRDDDPAGGGSGVVTNANSNRLVDTGVISANAEYLMGLESLYIRGPFSFQAEYGWNWIDNAVGIAPSSTGFHPALTPAQNYMFNGGYLQVAYTLTGENRAYDRRFGTLAREYFGKRGPYNNAWITRDENGNIISSWGAWEVAARYSYVNLNDGIGLTRIQGGEMQGVTLGLNWYLNNNMCVMFDWTHDYRYALPTGTIPGFVDGYGARVQFQF
jgi:phosphate-selective porin OprO and OprP